MLWVVVPPLAWNPYKCETNFFFLQVAIPESNTFVNATLNITGNYTGLSSVTLTANLWPKYGKDYSSDGDQVDFATVFGVLFSGVTGVMAGANMSGESFFIIIKFYK